MRKYKWAKKKKTTVNIFLNILPKLSAENQMEDNTKLFKNNFLISSTYNEHVIICLINPPVLDSLVISSILSL